MSCWLAGKRELSDDVKKEIARLTCVRRLGTGVILTRVRCPSVCTSWPQWAQCRLLCACASAHTPPAMCGPRCGARWLVRSLAPTSNRCQTDTRPVASLSSHARPSPLCHLFVPFLANHGTVCSLNTSHLLQFLSYYLSQFFCSQSCARPDRWITSCFTSLSWYTFWLNNSHI